jgi:hypothetical protein
MQIGASGLPMLIQKPDNRQTFQNTVMRSVSSEQSAGVVVAISNRNTAVSASATVVKSRNIDQNDTPELPQTKSKGLAAYKAMENGSFLAQYG